MLHPVTTTTSRPPRRRSDDRGECAAVRQAATAPHAPSAARHNDRPAARMLWHDRACTTTANAVQLQIPLIGRADEDLALRLSAQLDRLWTGRPNPAGGVVTSVVAVVGRSGGQDSLIVFLSLDRLPAHRRVDDARMARELQACFDMSRRTSGDDTARLPRDLAGRAPNLAERRHALL